MRAAPSIAILATGLAAASAFADGAGEPMWDVETVEVVGEAEPLVLEEARRIDSLRGKFRENPEPVFSALADDEWIEVEYQSQGCFHSFERVLKIHRGERPRLVVDTPGWFPDDDLQGEIPLSEEDLRALDTLLSYYRSERFGSCTTREKLSFRWKKGLLFPRTTKSEAYEDEACGPNDGEDLVIFWKILNRL